MDIPAHATGEPNSGAVLWVSIAITAFAPGVDVPGEVVDDVTLTLLTTDALRDPGVEARDREGVFEALIYDTVDHGFPAECRKMFRQIVCRKQQEVFCCAIKSDRPTRVEHMIVWLQRDASVVRIKRPSDRARLPWDAAFLQRPSHGDDDDGRRTGV